jgi:hypothetical protein
MAESMNTKTTIFVVIVFVVAAIYALEVVLTLIDQGLTGPVVVKAGIVVALLFYAITRITKSKAGKGKDN